MKKLIIINGTVGIGKTETGNALKLKLKKSALVDSDWCWNVNAVKNSRETYEIFIKNTSYILNNYLSCEDCHYVFLTGVLEKEQIISDILDRCCVDSYELLKITLTCSQEELERRIEKDCMIGLRNKAKSFISYELMKHYDSMNTVKIDTSNNTPDEVAERIIQLL